MSALLIAILGFVPIANWIAGGHRADWYSTVAGEWLSGSAIAIGGGVVLAILSRRMPLIWRDGALTKVTAWTAERPWTFILIVAALAFASYVWIAFSILSARPLLIDELVQMIQARIFVAGRLWLPAPTHPEFTSVLHMVDAQGRWYAQFPAGGPAMLALGVLVGAPWIIGPLCGAISIVAFWFYLRVAEPRRTVAIGAVLLFACAPFMAFMAGSHMNHVPTLMWITIAMALMARVVTSDRERLGLALWSGFALGAAATIRPVDALAFALPTGVWYAIRALKDRPRWRELVASGVGIAIPVGAMLWVNANTTGHPLLFGYQVLWGSSHDLGFHRAPWGVMHTPARGLELINIYFLRLQSYLFESPLPSLVPTVAALGLTRRIGGLDRYLLASAALLVGLYFAYWHDGFFLGPRFVYTLLPFLALWTARLPALVRERIATPLVHRAVLGTYLVAGVMAAFVSIPIRAQQYRNGLYPIRLDFMGPARRAGVHDALILVRESWGSQIIARMWALGVPRSESEMLYRGVDSCVLDDALTRLEPTAVRDTAAFLALQPLLRDSARVVKSEYSLDTSERMLPGLAYPPPCLARLADDRAGVMLLTPIFTMDRGTNVYARDLHARDTLLLQQYSGRPVYLMRPANNDVGAPLVLLPLSTDSLRKSWSVAP